MKKHLTLLLLLCVYSTIAQEKKLINYPIIEKSNTEELVLYGVELSDKYTTLHMEAYYMPGDKIIISSKSYLQGLTTNKTYRLTACDDFELDKWVGMSESGSRTVTLRFEPLDPREKQISLIEGPAGNAFRIEGIRLAKPSNDPKEFSCALEGEVKDRSYSSCLILLQSGKDARTNSYISIPIHDGKFSYELRTKVNETYELTFWDEYKRGSWHSTPFISEAGTLHFTLYSQDEAENNTISTDAPLNAEAKRASSEVGGLYSLSKLEKEKKRLDAERRYFSDEAYALMEQIKAATFKEEREKLYAKGEELNKNNRTFSPEGNALNEKAMLFIKEQSEWWLNYAKGRSDINGYCVLYDIMRKAYYYKEERDLSPYSAIFDNVYKKKFPFHPYTAEISRILGSLEIKVGDSYIDFSAPDPDGNMVRLSKAIKGKVALIDLWASWCGPCRRSSVSMIPVYEAYKDKGFEVVGVARERNDTEAMRKAIEKDKYPWLNLVDLNDKHNIWSLYGVANSGGKTFLVDKDGKILAIQPTAEEVRKILDEKLK